jgi:hypothetical protein
MNNAKVIKMGVELYNWSKNPATANFSANNIGSLEEADSLFRKTLLEEAGIVDGKLDYKTFSNPMVKWKLFQLTSETIDAIVPRVLTNQFDRFVETKNAAWNEQLIFKVNSPDLFRVDKVANGNTNVRGQRLDQRALRLYPVMREVAVQESLYRIAAGEVDFASYVNKVAVSMATAIKGDIYSAIYNSYDGLEAEFQENGSFDPQTFNRLVARVQGANGGLKPVAFGTKMALSKITPAAGFTAYPGYMSQGMMDDFNISGFLGNFQGTDLIELEQALVPNTLDFAIDDNFVIVAPAGTDKIVKLGFEGESIITENTSDLSVDQTFEYNFQKAWAVDVLAAGRYGLIRLA